MNGRSLWLRVYIGESDRWHGKPLYQAIVELLHERGLAGATVLRGVEGFGAGSRIHTARILRMSEDLPLIVDAIDTREQIEAILPELDAMIGDGLAMLAEVNVLSYRGGTRRDADD